MSKTILEEAKSCKCKLLDNTEIIKFRKNKNWEINLVSGKKKNNIFKTSFYAVDSIYPNLKKKSNFVDKKFNQDFQFHKMLKDLYKFPKKVNSINNINVVNTQISQYYPNYLFGNAASNFEFLKIFAFGNNQVISDIDKNFENMSIFHVTYSLGTADFITIPFINENLIKYKFSNNDLKIIKKV